MHCLPTHTLNTCTGAAPPLGIYPSPSNTHSLQVLFVHIDMSEDSAMRVADFFNIDADDVPTCRLINLESDMKKFVPEFEGIDMEKLGPWVQSYLDGELKVGLACLCCM